MINNLLMEEISKKLEEGMTYSKLSIIYRIPSTTLVNRLKEYYSSIGRDIPIRHQKVGELPVNEIIEMRKEGKSFEDIAKIYKVSSSTIIKRMNKYCEENNEEVPKPFNLKKLPIEKIVEMRIAGETIEEIANRYDVSIEYIKRLVKEYYRLKDEAVPRILRSKEVIKTYIKQGTPIDEIIAIAKKRNIIIPEKLIAEVTNEGNER